MNYIKLFILLFFSSFSFANQNIEKISIQLNWKFQFQYAGFIIAKEKGFYKGTGFDVKLKEFDNSTNIVKDVLNNKTTFALSNSLLMIERQNDNIVLLANYYKQSPHVIATNKAIKHPKDLESKFLMSSKERLINTPIDFMFKHLSVNYENIKFKKNTYNIQSLIDNDTDAMEVYKTNELYRLEKEKVPYSILDPKDYGFNSGAVNMFTSQENIDKYGIENIQNFIDATNKGWKYAFENIQETTDIIYNKYNNSLKKSKDALLFEAHETKKLFLLDEFKIGDINKQELYRWYDILSNYGLIKNQNRYENFLFNKQWKERVYTKDELTMYIVEGIFLLITFTVLLLLYFSKTKAKILKESNINLEKKVKIRTQELQYSIDKFEQLFNSTMEAIMLLEDGKIIDVNQVALDLFGYSLKSDMIGISPQQLTTKESQIKLKEQLALDNTMPYEIKVIKRDGSVFDALIHGTNLKKQNLRLSCILDVSNIKKQEQIISQQSKLASMGEMIGNIAHQWRQPLSTISTASSGMQLQKEYGMLSDELFQESCNAINNNALYLSKTIDDFRNFIKGDKTKNLFNLKDNINSFLNLADSSIKSNSINIILDLEENIKYRWLRK